MVFNFSNVIVFLAILFTALVAGLFYAWTISVIPGTIKITDGNYLETMQNINREILNPWFFLIFFGSVICLLLSTFFQYKVGVSVRFWLFLLATLIYLSGTIGVTIFGNVPLNDSLELLNLSDLTIEEMESARQHYEPAWNRLNLIRTIASIIALMLLIVAMMNQQSGE